MADNKAKALEFKAQGNTFLKAQNFEEAVKCYTQAIELDATNHVFFSNRSAAYLSMGNAVQALEDGEQCTKVNPTWAKGYSRKGAALHAMKRYDDAIAAFKAGLEVDNNNAMLKSGLAAAEKAKASAAAPKRPSLFGPDMIAKLSLNPKFRGYLADPTFMAKLQMLQTNPQALGTMQSDPRIMEVLSFILGIPMSGTPDGPGGAPPAAAAPTASGAAPEPATATASAADEVPAEPEEPEAELSADELAARENKRNAAAKKNEGNALYKKKDFDAALACYEAAYKMDPDNVLILNNQAAVYFARKDYARCVEVCESAMERAMEIMAPFEAKAKILARMGNAKAKLDDLAGALKCYDQSLMESHDDGVYARRRKLVKQKKKRDAEAYWDDDLAEEAKQRGNEAFRAGNWRKAIEEYTEATKRNPREAKYFQNRASALMKVMDYPGALSDAEMAIKVDPTFVKGYYRKGLVQMAMKEYHKAIATFQAGLKIAPEDPGCTDGLRQVQRRIDREAASGEVDKERAARAMQDPEIQAIMRDPVVQQTLQDCSTDPTRIRSALMDPHMGPKLLKLRQAGILQMR